MILGWIALACMMGAAALLLTLAYVDMKTRLLPNEMVFGFATLGGVFHLTTLAKFLTVPEIILGGVIGFGMLYVIRYAANYYYKQDALGLGDVKLMGAAGIWLGPDLVMIALSAGALASLIHGLAFALNESRKNKTRTDFSRLQIPAGPGFVIGIFIAAALLYNGFRPWEF